MAAIITSEFRKNSRRIFTNDIKSSTVDDYFIGLGKTDSWPDTADAEGNQVTEYSRQFSAPLPIDTVIKKTDVLKNLMVLVKTDAAEVFSVIPRNNWAFNRVYKTYDPTDPRCFDYETIDGIPYYPCYVTSNDNIYMCLSNIDSNGEIVESTEAIPSGVGAVQESYHLPNKLSDAYLWAYVTALDEDSKFYTDQFVNYTYPNATELLAAKVATGGLVYGFKVVNGGDGAVTIDNSEIILVGTTRDSETDELEAKGDVEINSENGFDVVFGPNGIESITYTQPVANAGIAWKMNYESASVLVKVDNEISGVIEIVPYVLPYDGLGTYPDNDLPSYYAGIAVDFIGEVDGEAPIGYAVDVRQISLIKNPERNPLVTQYTDNDDDTNVNGLYTHDQAYDALKYIQLPLQSLTRDYIGRDFIIEQGSSGARAWLDISDNINERLYYHQNSSPLVNFKRFVSEGANEDSTIKITSIAGFWDEEYYKCNEVVTPEYLPETGEVIFYENRKPINRNYNQTDEVKLVIQF